MHRPWMILFVGVLSFSMTPGIRLAVAQAEPPDVSGLTIAELRAQGEQLEAPPGSEELVGEMTAAWVDANGLDSITPDDVLWILERFQRADTSLDYKNFSVKWTGFIEAPISGEYTFSVCPLNINVEHGQHSARQSTTIRIGSQAVLNSTPENWASEATPVALQAGQKVTIEMSFSYERTYEHSGSEPAMATLYWTGPGIARSLVPSEVLFPPTGSGNGLLAEYRSVVNGTEQVRSRIEPQIERCWIHWGSVVPKYAERQARAAARFRALLTDSAFFTGWETGGPDSRAVDNRERAFFYRQLLGFLDLPQRSACIQVLADQPAVLQALTQGRMQGFYFLARTGSPDDALDLLGRWAQLHPNAEPRISADFFHANRQQYREMTIGIVWQYRPHMNRLEQRYLVMPDGGCCLPVAYTLGYGYLVLGRIEDWIGKVDGQLGNSELTGDQRASWLLARAQAEEIRLGRPSRHLVSRERPLAGRQWLEEAYLVATSERAKRQALREIVVRLASLNRQQEAEQLIAEHSGSLSSAESTTALASWRSDMARLAVERQQRVEAERVFSRKVRLESLRTRLQRAKDRSDAAAIARCERLIAAAEAQANGQ